MSITKANISEAIFKNNQDKFKKKIKTKTKSFVTIVIKNYILPINKLSLASKKTFSNLNNFYVDN